jgi:SAM-dependent methyltransferase
MYRECAAGQFSRRDCTVMFYSRIDALLGSGSVLLNVGAGRGANIVADYSPYRRRLQAFKGRVGRTIGIDVDPVVLENPDLDEAELIAETGHWPLSDSSVDIIVCDHVLEHVQDASDFAQEAWRVLRPGGWFCARTPLKWGYIGICTRLIPNSLHISMLRWLQPQRASKDVFPTVYRMNTFGAIGKLFSSDRWSDHSYGFNGVPGYHGNRRAIFRLIEAWCWIMPEALSAKIHVFARKKA